MSTQLLAAVTLLLGLPSSAVGQAPRPPSIGPRPARVLWERPAWALTSVPQREPLGGLLGPGDEDYRYTGFFVGAGLGLGATLFSFVWCSDPDNACDSGRVLPLGVLMSAVLGTGGAVIGGLFPKEPPADSTGSP